MIDAAERRDISCSPERPPYTTPTRIRRSVIVARPSTLTMRRRRPHRNAERGAPASRLPYAHPYEELICLTPGADLGSGHGHRIHHGAAALGATADRRRDRHRRP